MSRYFVNRKKKIDNSTSTRVCRSLNDDGITTHFIGFQIDLIQQPDSILQRMRGKIFRSFLDSRKKELT